MRLGNLRSDGIHDLRFGHLLEEDWRDRPRHQARPCQSAAPWADDVDHLLVAALRRGGSERDVLGDWLVSVESAWARNIARGANVRRELVRDLDHLGLLVDARVYEILRRWISEQVAAPSASCRSTRGPFSHTGGAPFNSSPRSPAGMPHQG